MTSLCVVSFLSANCVHHQVTDSVEEHAVIEGQRYAREVEAQSPFKTVEISWTEAQELMKERNPKYIAAQNGYQQAIAHTPMVEELSDQVKSVVDLSFGDLFKPAKLAQSLQTPITQLPKQLASIGKLKDLSHEIEQSTWEKTSDSVAAEFKMREEKVKLHGLLRTGELIDGELGTLNSAPSLSPEADPKLLAARNAWQGSLQQSREKWLDQVRNFFDAEFHDVHFKKDSSGLPTYQDMNYPNLGEWQRWCRLTRAAQIFFCKSD